MGSRSSAGTGPPGRAPELAELGVTFADSPAEAVAGADVAVICVSDTPDVEAVLFGEEGVVDGAADGTLVIDCSTIAPSGSWDFAARLAEHDLRMVDAPVSGGSEGARNATLTIFVGGDAADVEHARPVLAAMGRTITHVGPIGAGQAVKAVNQVILAGTYLGVAEGMVLAMKAGLDVEQVVGALGGGAAQSWVLANRSGRMIDNDYPLGFKLALHRKDLGIALDLAAQLGAALPVSALAAQLETGLIARATATTTCRPWPRDPLPVRPRGLTTQSRPTSSIGSPSLPLYRGRNRSTLYMAGTSTRRGPSAGSGSEAWAYLPSRIAIIRPVTPPRPGPSRCSRTSSPRSSPACPARRSAGRR